MRALVLTLLLASATAGAVAGERLTIEPGVFTRRADGELTIDTAGRVVAFKPDVAWPASLATRMDGLVNALRFEPVEVDGRPVNARMRMRVTFAAEEQANGNMAVRIDNVTFPDEDSCTCAQPKGISLKVVHRAAPQYPEVGAMSGVDANVLLVVRVGRDGRIADVAVRQSALVGAKGPAHRVARVLERFEDEAVSAIRKWRVAVDIAPGVSPTDEDMSALIPVTFRMRDSGNDAPGRWVLEMRTTKRETPWLQPAPGMPVAGVSDIAGDGVVPVASRMRLVPPGAGAAL